MCTDFLLLLFIFDSCDLFAHIFQGCFSNDEANRVIATMPIN